jgi:hypothetical protein
MFDTQTVPWHCTNRTQTIIVVEIQSAETPTPSKTVGSRTAPLTTALYECGQTTFTHADVERTTALPPASARRSSAVTSATTDFRRSGFHAAGSDAPGRHSHANSHTFYLRYVGPWPAGGSVKVEVTIGEQLVFPLEARPVLRTCRNRQRRFWHSPIARAMNPAAFTISGSCSPAQASPFHPRPWRSRPSSPSASRRRPESRKR